MSSSKNYPVRCTCVMIAFATAACQTPPSSDAGLDDAAMDSTMMVVDAASGDAFDAPTLTDTSQPGDTTQAPGSDADAQAAPDTIEPVDASTGAPDAQACAAGTTFCGAAGCVDPRSDNNHCGNCATVCPMAMRMCVMGMCTASCPMGTEALGGSCVPVGAAPRPVAPLSLSDASLRRPTLRWQLPAGMTGARLELCRDRACNTIIESQVVLGSTARPMNALAPRTTVFWRLRGRVGNAESTTNSATWLFHVPSADATTGVDTSVNPHVDVNGDGLDDAVIGARGGQVAMNRPAPGTVNIFHGTVVGILPRVNRVLEGSASFEEFGTSVAGAGDVNGDGYADLVVGSPEADPSGRMNAGRASVFLGSPTGIVIAPHRVFQGLITRDNLGFSVAGLGDVNGDGYADIAISAAGASPDGRQSTGTVDIYYGSAAGIGEMPSRTLEGAEALDTFGYAVAGIGDVNGDGLSDVAVGSVGSDVGVRTDAGMVKLYYGNAMGLPAVPSRIIDGLNLNEGFGFAVSSGGDVNNDGYSDLLASAPFAFVAGQQAAGAVRIFHGSAMGIVGGPARTVTGSRNNDQFGSSLADANDINGDGFGDIIVGAETSENMIGAAFVFYGTNAGIPAMVGRTLVAHREARLFGHSVSGLGDVDGDGYRDIIVGARQSDPNQSGSATIYPGTMMGVSEDPPILLVGEIGSSFGVSIASLDRDNPRSRTSWTPLIRRMIARRHTTSK